MIDWSSEDRAAWIEVLLSGGAKGRMMVRSDQIVAIEENNDACVLHLNGGLKYSVTRTVYQTLREYFFSDDDADAWKKGRGDA